MHVQIHGEMTDPGTRLPVIDSVTLRVRDLETSRRFYGDVLGLKLHRDAEGTLEFAALGSDAPLVRLIEAPDAQPKPPRALGLYHYALLVPDRPALAGVLRRLAESEVSLQGASDHRVSEALYLADPDGHGIEIYCDRPSEEWTHTAEGEIYMTTDPLDLRELASTAGSAEGLPEATTIGHIHLHISDLKQAETFYVDGLGFDVTVRSYPGALFVAADGYHHHIGLNTWAGPRAAPPDDHTIGMVEFALRPPEKPAHAGETVADPDGIIMHLL